MTPDRFKRRAECFGRLALVYLKAGQIERAVYYAVIAATNANVFLRVKR